MYCTEGWEGRTPLPPPETVGYNIYVVLTVGGGLGHRVVGGKSYESTRCFHYANLSFMFVAILAQA
jgi:hypothetical protein